MPVVDRPGEAGVILTTRPRICASIPARSPFPVGRSIRATPRWRRRRCEKPEEEIGLDPAAVEVLGRLPRYRTTTGFRITPVLGIVHADVEPRPDPSEVADAFEVPLGFLMNAANHAKDSRVWQGKPRYFYTCPSAIGISGA